MGDYQGSQAFAQTSGGAESVNRNTGSLNYSIPLFELRGVVKSVDLALSLTYSAGISGNFGLPQNWTFGIPYVIPHQSVTTQARTYVIDAEWADSTGYKSGLKYINNHGMLFAPQIPALDLPSGNPGQYGWFFRYTDGAIDYFDQQGKLLEHDDIYGNSIYYSYADPEASPRTARLDYIQDSWKQRIDFAYDPDAAIYLKGPNQDQIIISYDHNGVFQVKFPVDYVTSFNYLQVASRTVIQSITHSTGLQSSFTYQLLPYLDSSNREQRLPTVKDHYHLDADGNYLSQTTYEFGTGSSGHTFTGFAVGKQMRSDSDGLMDSGPLTYEYDTLVLNINANNDTISATRVTFNVLHLPLVEDHYAVDQDGSVVDTFRAINTYIIDLNQHAQTPNYSSPTIVEHFNWDPTSQSWQQLRLANSTSDNYGCLTYSDQSLWDAQQGAYVLQQSHASTYVQATWGGQMLSSETYLDAVTGFTKQLQYGLSSDQKNVLSLTTSYQIGQSSQLAPWKTKNMSYDGQGRILTERVAWTDPSSAPTGSVLSYTNSNQYLFDSSNSYLIITATDPQGKATISKYATKIRNGPLIETQLPLGQKETFTYDVLGRQVSRTDALNDTTNLAYTVSQTENSVASLASNGYRLKYVLDVLGRCVQLLDNGGSSPSSPSTPTRTLYTKTYDSLSRITSETDAAGLVTMYNAYDAFNRILSVTDPDGNTATNTYDDVNLQVTSSINGSLRAKTQLDGFSRKTSTSKYPDSSDTSLDYFITETYEYDGFGKASKIEHYQESFDESMSLRLSTITRAFDVEDNVQLETVTSKSDVADSAYDTAERNYVRDVFGLIYTHSKTSTYSDGRSFVQDGPVDIYDDCKLHVEHQNQIGQRESFTYDDNGWKTSMTRFDGSVVNYLHDDLGRLVTTQDPEETETRTYLSNDRLSSISRATSASSSAESVTYSYSLDGSATAVAYPNNQINSYGLDNFGRIVTQTDVHGVQRNIVFDAQGHVAARSIGSDTVTYTYGTANHTYGQLLQDATSGEKKQLRTIQYDGYGRANQVTVMDIQASTTLLSSQYQYNAQNRLQTIKMSSSLPDSKQLLNCTKNFAYDGFGQLMSEVVAYADGTTNTVSFVYDGNCNILSKTENGIAENRTYNAIGQRTDSSFTYDANGRLLTDSSGRSYTYLADDRLQSTSGAIFTYHPDGSLASSTNDAYQTSFYYDNGAVNATSTDDDDSASYQLEPGRRIASYDKTLGTATYYIENNGSTVLTTGSSATGITDYSAYGNPTEATTLDDQFGYRQEYTEPSSGLVYLRSRFYQPDHAAFITMDATQKENRYAYCGGDPINRSDATGHSEGGAVAAGLVAGVLGTAVIGAITGGVGAVVFGPTSIGASLSASAISGAAGNVIGDAAAHAAAHEKMPTSSLWIDALSGAVGAVVGAGSGGAAGRFAMEAAESFGQSVAAVGRWGTAVSSVVGSAGGTIAGGAVQHIVSGQPIFSDDSALSFVTGAISGLGGGIHTSMSYLSWSSLKIIPVRATTEDIVNIRHQTWHELGYMRRPKVLVSFVSAAEHQQDLRAFGPSSTRGRLLNDIFRLRPGSEHDTYDTVVVRGQGGDFFPAMDRTVNGQRETVLRPMKGAHFAEYLRQMQGEGGLGDNRRPLKLVSSRGALHNAQTLADVLQRTVWASYGAVSAQDFDVRWVRHTPT